MKKAGRLLPALFLLNLEKLFIRGKLKLSRSFLFEQPAEFAVVVFGRIFHRGHRGE